MGFGWRAVLSCEAAWLLAACLVACDEEPSGVGPDSGLVRGDAGGLAVGTDAGSFAPRDWPGCEALVAQDDAGAEGCLFDGAHGVYVDGERGDDAQADGSRDRPFATLVAAIVSAAQRGTRVFVCGGTYRESIAFGAATADVPGVYGSLSCATFLPETGAPRTLVVGTPGAPALRVEGSGSLRIEHIDFEASDATGLDPGASFTAAFVQDSDGLLLHDVSLRASAGQDAPDAIAVSEPAPAGRAGLDGTAACVRDPNLGGLSNATDGCVTAALPGGSGGSGGRGSGDGGSGMFNGSAVPSGESAGAGWGCDAGEAGAALAGSDGFAAGPGLGARGFGAIVAGRFVGFAGQAGSDAGNGFPGWGGGGARAPASCVGMSTATGASAGSGGSGGCGGAGGKGGAAGGSSIALVVLDAELALDDVRLSYGAGGAGGDGALGQQGGAGAPGGKGGAGANGSSAACDGAPGGAGGTGGAGGGGNGGHAIGVLYSGPRPRWLAVEGPLDAPLIWGGAAGRGALQDPNQPDRFDGRPGVSALELEL